MTTAMVTPEVSETTFSVPPDSQNTTSERTEQEEFSVLVEAGREFGTRYGAAYSKAEATFSEAFAENVDDFLRLRDMFPKQGSHATRTIAGVEYTWKTFCKEFLCVTPEYFGQLVRKLRPGLKPKPEPRRLEDTPAYHAGFRAGQEAAVEESEKQAEDECKDLITESEVEEDSDVSTVTQSRQSKLVVEAVGYFATYAKDAPKFSEELRALVRHFGLGRKISVELL